MAENNNKTSALIYGVNGPVVTIKGKTDFSMLEMVYVGQKRLIGEVSDELAKLHCIPF